MAEDNNKLLQLIAEQNILSSAQIESLTKKMQEGSDSLEDVLVQSKLVDEETICRLKAKLLKVPYVNLREKVIAKNVLEIVPETTAKEHLIVAYERTPGLLKLAMADPLDRQMIEFMRKKFEGEVAVGMASKSAIRDMLSRYHESLEADVQEFLGQSVQPLVTAEEGVSEEAPIIRVTDAILQQAILQKASDIHMEPLEDKVIIRYRIDGLLYDRLVLEKRFMIGLVARIKVLAGLKIDEHRLPQDGRFKIESDDYKIAFRVSILPVFDGEKVVMRLLDESGQTLSLTDMNLSPPLLALVRRNIERPHGMILVTGPTGSGKTTTLYAFMRELNTPDVNISTVEDPIEYRMPRINQTQVKPQIGLTFANGLRALVRQDPDIIMVGEIRDQETAALAVNASLTGHLVLSTLHTNSAAGALPRLMDMKVEPFLLASTLNLVMGQRLVRRLCDKCRKETHFTPQILEQMSKLFDLDHVRTVLVREQVIDKKAEWKDVPMYEPQGCSVCHQGYRSRLGIYEFLEVTTSIQKVITSEATAQAISEVARKEQDMITMLEDGLIKVVRGVTSLEEVLRVAQE